MQAGQMVVSTMKTALAPLMFNPIAAPIVSAALAGERLFWGDYVGAGIELFGGFAIGGINAVSRGLKVSTLGTGVSRAINGATGFVAGAGLDLLEQTNLVMRGEQAEYNYAPNHDLRRHGRHHERQIRADVFHR